MPATKRRTTWDSWGNSTAVERLRRAVVQGPRHAYLLTGPHHIGKLHVARRFAASLLCQSTERPDEFCGNCSTCRRVLKGVHPDVTRFDLEWQANQDEGSSKNLSLNIKTVREIGRHVSLRPAESDWRVVLVDDVETMQESAQEAFLKTLEEPPSYVVLLMLATDAELLLPTILSRCAVVSMVPASDAVVTEALLAAGAGEADAQRIAVAVRGRVGLGLRALEDASLLEVLSEHVSEAVRWVGGDSYQRMAEAYRLAEGFTSDRERVFDRIATVEAAWRELMLSAHGVETVARHPIHGVGSLQAPEE
ncbi:MAG: hypothetical protein M3173_07710, partial [Chloroflexota bacterium]|nr:hypothetical protein [Chloroflexota bacterium]